MNEYEIALKEFIKLRKTMIEDLEAINGMLIDDSLNECLIRVSARTLYSFIETSSHIWKHLAYLKEKADLSSGMIQEPRLSEADISAIFEKSYYLDEAGLVRERRIYSEPSRNLRFALRIFAMTHNFEVGYIFKDRGWEAYKNGLAIRNRFTHPKANSDLSISEEEHELLHEVFDWFFGTIIFLGVDKSKVH